MYVRSRLDGMPVKAELSLRPAGLGRQRFVLLIHDRRGRRIALDRLSASIGYELIEFSPEDLAALTLAGFRMPRAGQKNARPSRLLGLIRHGNRTEPRVVWLRDQAAHAASEGGDSWFMILEPHRARSGDPHSTGPSPQRRRQPYRPLSRPRAPATHGADHEVSSID
jgi:hypothetical protein